MDDLNLKYGILHQDISPRNLLADPSTDNIVLFDFNWAAQVRSKKKRVSRHMDPPRLWSTRDDVKGVLFAMHELITRDPYYTRPAAGLHVLDESTVRGREKWVKHPDVRLDHDVSDYYDALMAWVQKRREQRRPSTKHYLKWPLAPKTPTRNPVQDCDACEDDLRFPGPGSWWVSPKHYRRHGLYLEWQRPPASKLVPGRRLLATGRYADEEQQQHSSSSNGIDKAKVTGGGARSTGTKGRITKPKPKPKHHSPVSGLLKAPPKKTHVSGSAAASEIDIGERRVTRSMTRKMRSLAN